MYFDAGICVVFVLNNLYFLWFFHVFMERFSVEAHGVPDMSACPKALQGIISNSGYYLISNFHLLF